VSHLGADSAAPGLAVVSLNLNYWVVDNPSTATPGAPASILGQAQFAWLDETLALCAEQGEAVCI